MLQHLISDEIANMRGTHLSITKGCICIDAEVCHVDYLSIDFNYIKFCFKDFEIDFDITDEFVNEVIKESEKLLN